MPNTLPPGLAGYVASQQMRQQRDAGELQQATGIMGLLQHVQAQQQAAQLRDAMAKGADPKVIMSLPGGLQALTQMQQFEKAKTEAARATQEQQFFSPENRAQFMTPSRPAEQLPPEVAGPPQPAVPGQFDLRRFAEAGAAQGIKGTEPLLNHLGQREQARATLAATIANQQATRDQRTDESAWRAEQAAEAQRQAHANRLALVQAAAAGRMPRSPELVATPDPQNPGKYTWKPKVEGGAAEPPGGRRNQGLSAGAQKELFDIDKQIQSGEQAIKFIDQAAKLNDKAAGFYGAGAVSSLATLLPGQVRPKIMDNTENLKNIILNIALPQLKATFGGAPSEGERKVSLEMQGSVDKSPSVRKEIFQRANEAVAAKLAFNRDKAKQIRSGTYFMEGQQPQESAPRTVRFEDLR